MKITELVTDERRGASVRGEKCRDLKLIFFGSSVLFRTEKKEKLLGRDCGILLPDGFPLYLRSADGTEICFDYVSFTASAQELNYISSLGIRFGIPFRLRDSVLTGNVMELLKMRSFCSKKNLAEYSEHALKLLLIGIGEQITAHDSPVVPHYFKLRSLRDSVYANPAAAPGIDEICFDLNISRTYFHRIYLSAFGSTYMRDVIGSRIGLAKKLLAETDMSVSMIAEECGYESDSYFMQQFKRTAGCTPTAYRRNYGKDV